MNNKNPKYDNDLVTLGYLKKTFQVSGEDVANITKIIPKSYSSPPPPPYYVGTILYYNNSIYRCKKDKTQGVFSLDDWELIVSSDSGEFQEWVEQTYSVDKLQWQQQIDDKIETYYQETDPNTWTTDIEKSKHVGDYWFKTTDDTQWRYSQLSTNPITYGWLPVDVPTAVYDLIDTKKSIYTSKPTTYKQNDLWIIENTISDDDIPIGTQENPIAKGDWVFSITDSNTYNKNHWVKRDTDITLNYLKAHYYTTTEIEAISSEIEENTDEKITTAQGEINLYVEQNYTSKTEFEQKVLDYDEEIGEINSIVETHSDTISDLDISVGKIQTTVANDYVELKTNFDNYAKTTSVTEISNRVTQLQTDTYTKTEINTKLTDGSVTKVHTVSGTYDENGMTYEKSNANTKTTINEVGVNVRNKNTNDTILFAGYVDDNNTQYAEYKGQTIVATENILVDNYLIVGNHSRFEDYEGGTGCFYIG